MKKGQIKLGETFAIIFIVYIMLVSGFIWYNKINTQKLAEIQQKDNMNRGFEKYNFLINADLLHTSEQGVIDDSFDSDSIDAFERFANTPEGTDYLQKRLGEAKVQITVYNYTELNELAATNLDDPLHNPKIKQPRTIYSDMPDVSLIKSMETFRIIVPVNNQSAKRTDIGLLVIQVPRRS